MKYLIILCKGEGYEDEKIALVSTGYPFNTIMSYEKAGYKLMLETMVNEAKVMDVLKESRT